MKKKTNTIESKNETPLDNIQPKPTPPEPFAPDPETKNRIAKAAILEVTPDLMSAVTRYSEETCRRILGGYYENKATAEAAEQSLTLFLAELRGTLYNPGLQEILSSVIDGKKVRKGDLIRLAVNFEHILRRLNPTGE